MFNWLTTKWPSMIVIALLFGILGGISCNKLISDYYTVYNTPQKFNITHIEVIEPTSVNKARTLVVYLKTPEKVFNKACDRFNSHIFLVPGSSNAYPIDMIAAGGNFISSIRNPIIHLNIPNMIPSGDYNYTIRTIWFCNMWPVGLISFHTETDPITVHLNEITEIPLPEKGTNN